MNRYPSKWKRVTFGIVLAAIAGACLGGSHAPLWTGYVAVAFLGLIIVPFVMLEPKRETNESHHE